MATRTKTSTSETRKQSDCFCHRISRGLARSRHASKAHRERERTTHASAFPNRQKTTPPRTRATHTHTQLTMTLLGRRAGTACWLASVVKRPSRD